MKHLIAVLAEELLGPKLPVVEGWDERCAVHCEQFEGVGQAREMTGIEKMEREARANA